MLFTKPRDNRYDEEKADSEDHCMLKGEKTINCNLSRVRTILKPPAFHTSTQNQMSSEKQ